MNRFQLKFMLRQIGLLMQVSPAIRLNKKMLTIKYQTIHQIT